MFGAMRVWSITAWLIAINVAVYVLNILTRRLLADWGAFSGATVVYGFQLWRFVTFQFLHASPSHLFFNMVSLYFFGPMIEGYLGARRFLAFYLMCGVGGGLLFLIFWQLSVLDVDANVRLVGASAGIFGVLIAAARVAPDTTIMLIFPPVPLKLKVLALIMLGIALLTVLEGGNNAGGEAAHLGGAAVGAALIARPRVLDVFEKFTFRRRPKNRGYNIDDWR